MWVSLSEKLKVAVYNNYVFDKFNVFAVSIW
jgi:hypothetical protein